MEKISKTTTRVTRTTIVTLNDEQIDAIIREACGFPKTANVGWDCGDGYVRDVTITHITVEEGEDK